MKKRFKVEFHTDLEFDNNIFFDTVDATIDDTSFDASNKFMEDFEHVNTVSINISDYTLSMEGEQVDGEYEPSVISCQLIIERQSTYCLIVLDDNTDVFVECWEI